MQFVKSFFIFQRNGT